jgi:hypothetical protein
MGFPDWNPIASHECQSRIIVDNPQTPNIEVNRLFESVGSNLKLLIRTQQLEKVSKKQRAAPAFVLTPPREFHLCSHCAARLI